MSIQGRVLPDDFYSQSLTNIHTNADLTVRASEGAISFSGPSQTPRWEAPTSGTYMQGTVGATGVFASGLPAGKKVLRVRTVRWMEYLPIEGDITEGNTESEPHDPALLGVLGQLSAQHTSHTSRDAVKWFQGKVMAVANAAYHVMQPIMNNYIVPKAKQYLTSAMSEYAAAPLLMLAA